MSDITHSIELVGGYTSADPKSKKDLLHTKVTFGRRLTVKDLTAIEDNPQAGLKTQHEDLIRQRMITAFGTMKMPITLPALLSLNRVDRQDIAAGANLFLQMTRGDRTFKYLDDNKVKLYFGFKIADIVYDTVQFGNQLTGNDEVEADRAGLDGIRRVCFELGKQISRLESSEHSLTLEGTLSLEDFDELDGDDLGVLRIGGEMFTQSFRLSGKKVSGQRNGKNGSDDSN